MPAAARLPLVSARISSEKKAGFVALAKRQGLSESSLLTLLIDTVLRDNAAIEAPLDIDESATNSQRVCLRMRPGDMRRVCGRAAARQLKPASYLTLLIRAHVRSDPPLPTVELEALKSAVNRLSSVNRSLLALASSPEAHTLATGDIEAALHDTLVRVKQVHRCVADLVRGNLISWESVDA